MDFPFIIHRNNNYVENFHATGYNENKNIIFLQQFTYLNNLHYAIFHAGLEVLHNHVN